MIIQPRPFNLRKTLTAGSVVLIALYFYYQRPPPLQFWKVSGEAWSTYSVKFTDTRMDQPAVVQLKADIDALLTRINAQMSTYQPDSEISRFNAHASTEPMPVSAEFAAVVRRAIALCEETGGVFTPGLDRLINAWGFGHLGPRREPDATERAEAMRHAGCDAVEVTAEGALRKTDPGTALNVNALVEGWAVDAVASLLEQRSVTNYFVEIGGEVFARGQSEKMRPWRVGIDRPVDGALPGEAYDLIVALDRHGLATSGNYRKFTLDDEGRKISHILDPRTGKPATSRLASVTVIAPDTATADALATALFVMGTEEGLAFLAGKPGVEAAFIEHDDQGGFSTRFTPGFEAMLVRETR